MANTIAALDVWSSFFDSPQSRQTNIQKFTDYVAALVEQQSPLSRVDYIAVKTRYTHRLLRDPAYTSEVLHSCHNNHQLHPVFIASDATWDPDNHFAPYVDPSDTFARDAVNSLLPQAPISGVVVFKTHCLSSLFDAVEALKALDYCGFCHVECIMQLQWYSCQTFNGGPPRTLLLADVDTESG